jgi:aryl carrier-like protein
LRPALAQHLPEYMLPSAWVHLPAWPLTPNGKLDRKALPAPDAQALDHSAYAAPEGDIEATLATLWAELLGIERVGRHDHFFALGGHSLLAVQLIARLRQRLGCAIALAELFAHPVLADFAQVVTHAAPQALTRISVADRQGPLPLSYAQQRLWFLAQLEDQASAAYHIVAGLRITGELDRLALQAALDRIVQRHEALRTSFAEVDGAPVQRIHEAGGFPLASDDLSAHPEPERALQALAARAAQAPFDLANTCCSSPCITSWPMAGRWAGSRTSWACCTKRCA